MNWLSLELQDLIISTIQSNNDNKIDLFYLKLNFINNYYVSEFIINRYYLNSINSIKYDYYFKNKFKSCWLTNFLDYYCRKGEFDLIKFIHFRTKEKCTTYAIYYASYYGHFKIVKFLCENRTEGFNGFALKYAPTQEIRTCLLNHLHLKKKDQ